MSLNFLSENAIITIADTCGRILMFKAADCLPGGTLLDRFRVEERLGGGGFSQVYLATELNVGRKVALKEFFPMKLARRVEGRVVPREPKHQRLFNRARQLFFLEASVLVSLEHPNIVNVTGLFTANGTIYMVMDFEEGRTLSNVIRSRGKLNQSTILALLQPLLDGLRLLHAHQILHLDIKPGNIYLRDNSSPILLDFGAVQKILTLERPIAATVVSHGYSPPEQTTRRSPVGPWSDLYALGATLRACMEGKAPVAAGERLKRDTLVPAVTALRGRYTKPLLAAIDWCMALDPAHRPRTVEALQEALSYAGRAQARPSLWERFAAAFRHRAT